MAAAHLQSDLTWAGGDRCVAVWPPPQLPAVVDPEQVRAKFDKATSTLKVTLQVVKELEPPPPPAAASSAALAPEKAVQQEKPKAEPQMDIADVAKLFV